MVNTNKMQFGYNLKRICEENNITIKEIHEATKIPLNTLYSITKRKTREPRDQKLKEKVFDYLVEQVPDLTWEDFYDSEVIEQRNGKSDVLSSLWLSIFNSLNDDGRREAIKRLNELAQLDQYKKED